MGMHPSTTFKYIELVLWFDHDVFSDIEVQLYPYLRLKHRDTKLMNIKLFFFVLVSSKFPSLRAVKPIARPSVNVDQFSHSVLYTYTK